MQKYVLVKLLEKMDEGAEFSASDWPLHVTITSNFAVDWNSSDLSEKLAALLAKQKPIDAMTGDDEYFGPQGQTQVTVLNMNGDLASLHNGIVTLLESTNAVFDEPQYIKEGYRAHATVQENARLNKDDHVLIDEVSIIDMFPNENIHQRKLLKTIKLHPSTEWS